MNRYIIESKHTEAECHHILEQFVYFGFIYNFDWGCQDGVHSGWAIVPAENEQEALLAVPASLRSSAQAVRLNKFTPEMIQASHEAPGA